MNILGKRYLFFIISLLIILPGIALFIIYGAPLSIDFTSGSLMEVSFSSGNLPAPGDVISLLNESGIKDAEVRTTADNTLQIRAAFLEDVQDQETISAQLQTAMEERFSDTVTILRFENVGPTIGQQVTRRAALAVGVAALAVILYITVVFRRIPHAFRYGVCAIIAMIHDVAIVFSIVAIGARLFGWQMDALFLTALLTVIGFSTQDKIVVFDRIRENSTILRRLDFETLANHSIVQTLQRSINTQLMTVEFMLLALALFGGVTLREFAVILLVGLLSGTYSSIFIAAPILVIWEKKEWKNWFRRNGEATA